MARPKKAAGKTKPTHDRSKKIFKCVKEPKDNLKVLGKDAEGVHIIATAFIDNGGRRLQKEELTFILNPKDIPAFKAAIDRSLEA